jgi:hypothetical protein
MDDLTFIDKIRKIIKMRHEISSLLNKKEQKDNEGTVININSKSKD